MKTITYQTEIEIQKEVDIFIAGGGPAGVAAAVTAARQGKSVFLIDSLGCFGGLGTAGLVPCYMQFTDGKHFLADGIGKEIWDKLQLLRNKDPNADSNAIQPEILKRIYDQMMVDSGAEFAFFTTLLGVVKSADDTIDLAVVNSKSGTYAVRARYFLDCTGDGDLSVQAGALFQKGDANGATMPSTLCSFWAGIDWDHVDRAQQSQRLEQAFDDHVFTVEDRHLTGMSRTGRSYGGGNIGHAFHVDGTNEHSLTQAMIEQRQRLTEFETYYRNYQDGYAQAEIIATGAILGVRESRRITCLYELCADDFLRRATFDDEIGRYAYPVDIHPSSGSKADYAKFEKEYEQDFHYKNGESYGIPYRSLLPQGFSNLLVAGRCIGTDQKMQSSIRVMPGCYITGMAAGMAAATAAETRCSFPALCIPTLQQNLRKAGAYLPF